MDFNTYQKKARTTAVYPNIGTNLWYPALGLAGEAGEVAEKVKKIYRDDAGVVTLAKILEICKELGDALWYISNVASELNLDLDEVARLNLEKLAQRAVGNKLHGSGDER